MQSPTRSGGWVYSDDADFITGQTLVVDCGTTSLMSLFTNFRERPKNRFGTGCVPRI